MSFLSLATKIIRPVASFNGLLRLPLQHQPSQLAQLRPLNYQAYDMWKSVLLVSTQGSKKGRGKRKTKFKDLNLGQALGDGKLKMEWPGLNTGVLKNREVASMKLIGEDIDREKRLTEIRNQMDKYRRQGVAPHERGFTSDSLDGKSIGAPLSYDDVNFRKKKTTSCFVFTGNKNGVFGYGLGKSTTLPGAMKLAKTHASQRLLHVDRYEDRTVFHDFYQEYYFTKVYAEKKPAGYGLVCHRIIKKICQLIGIKDLYVKVEGSRNKKNIVKAFISGLLSQKKYSDLASEKNLNVVEFKPETNFTPVLLAKRPSGEKQEDHRAAEIQHETNINLYLFGNRCRQEKAKKKPFYYEFKSYKDYCKRRDKENQQKKAKLHRVKLLEAESAYPRRKPAEVAQAEA